MATGSELTEDLKKITDKAMRKLSTSLNEMSQSSNVNSSKQLREVIEKQQEILETLTASAAFIGEVVSLKTDQENKDIIVSCYGRLLSVKTPLGINVSVGDMVKLSPSSSQIISVIERFNVGSVCTVNRVIDDVLSEVNFNGTPRFVMNGKYKEKLQADDRVVLDSSGSTIVAYLGKSTNRFKLGSKPTICWDDICGLEDAKNQLQEMIEAVVTYKNLFKYYNLKQPNGALIFGPPGCGKTMLLEAAASSVAALYGAEAIETGFINVKGPEILDMFVGNSEKNIRALFLLARKHKEKYGYPAIIAIDECESILSRRGSGVSSDMEKTVVPTFLAEMNGIDDSSAIVFLCTNRQDVLDPAVIRDKRIDRQIKISRPNKTSVESIFSSNLKKYPLAADADKLIKVLLGAFYSDEYAIYEIVRKREGTEETLKFKLADLVNGAMAVGIVEKAVWQAFQRDKNNGGEEDEAKRSGLTEADLVAAVALTHRQKFDLNHSDELKEFGSDFKDQIISINKIRSLQDKKK